MKCTLDYLAYDEIIEFNDDLAKENQISNTENQFDELDVLWNKYKKFLTDDDKETMKIFSSTESLGLRPDQIDSKVGTFGVPEFGTRFVLNQDGTCVYDGKKFTYKVEKHDFSQDINPDYRIGIVFYQPNGEVYFAFFPHNSTTLYSCGIESLVYTGN